MDKKLQAFNEFMSGKNVPIPLGEFVFNLFLTLMLAYILVWAYVRFAKALSNRRRFGGNFPVIAVTTMVIITVVKASLALSLGLVGALSIIRFRAAIKDPEEISYLFVTIAIGLGLGANQRAVTVIGFLVILLAVGIRGSFFRRSEENKNLFLTVSGEGEARFALPQILEILQETCAAVDLKRFDQSAEASEALFVVELEDIAKLEETRRRLSELNGSLSLTLLDQGVAAA